MKIQKSEKDGRAIDLMNSAKLNGLDQRGSNNP